MNVKYCGKNGVSKASSEAPPWRPGLQGGVGVWLPRVLRQEALRQPGTAEGTCRERLGTREGMGCASRLHEVGEGQLIAHPGNLDDAFPSLFAKVDTRQLHHLPTECTEKDLEF